jgi:hypothetical protein
MLQETKAQHGPQTHRNEETHHAASEACTGRVDRYFSKCSFAMTRHRMNWLSPSLGATEIVPACTLYGFWGVLFLAGAGLHAQQTTENLEKLARNPVGDAVKMRSSRMYVACLQLHDMGSEDKYACRRSTARTA